MCLFLDCCYLLNASLPNATVCRLSRKTSCLGEMKTTVVAKSNRDHRERTHYPDFFKKNEQILKIQQFSITFEARNALCST